MHRRSSRAGPLLLALAAGCGGGGGSHAQKLADYYAPGVKLGAPLAPEVKSHFHLEPLPIPGFADTSYIGPDGVHVLGMMLEAPASSKGARQRSRRKRHAGTADAGRLPASVGARQP